MFPNAPTEYNPEFMTEVVRAFSVFLQQVNNPGPWQASSLTLPNLQTDDSGLRSGGVFSHNGVLRIPLGYSPYVRGGSATGSAGAVTVSTT
jgi:hypothetical protein